MYHGQRFKVTTRSGSGMSSDSFVDFSFLEDGDEMFAIGCTVNDTEYETSYPCPVSRPSKSAAIGRSHYLSTKVESRLNATRPLLSISIFARMSADEINSRFAA